MLGEAFLHLGAQAFKDTFLTERLIAENLIALDDRGWGRVVGELQAVTDGSSLDADLREEPFEIHPLEAATNGA